MYEQEYGLAGRAFEHAPDPRYHFPSLSQRKALSAVSQTLNQGAGIAVVSGAAGIGKSSLVAHLVDQLAAQPVTVAALRAGNGPLVPQVVAGFGLEPAEDGDHALAALEAFLHEEARRGRRALLLLDDAHLLPPPEIEAVTRLAQIGQPNRGLLQIMAAVDSEAPTAGALMGDATPHPLEPLLSDEIEPYLRHRLLCAGWQGTPALDPTLAIMLHEATGGVPGEVNRAMSALLDAAADAGETELSGDRLAAWLDRPETPPAPVPDAPAQERRASGGLAEAQLAAIEHAFAEHDRQIARLRRDMASLREMPAAERDDTAADAQGDRLDAIEARLEAQEQALRHLLERLIAFLETSGGEGG